jgi:hypothetical protein
MQSDIVKLLTRMNEQPLAHALESEMNSRQILEIECSDPREEYKTPEISILGNIEELTHGVALGGATDTLGASAL